ncbi:MAG TPA: hypothetical protein VL098_04525 [Flavipsychrobacter sp.]|nr:hypothetical protein [Flavipsychrobacter sp.]
MKTHRSIRHLTGREQKVLLAIKNQLIALCEPVLIYYLGSNQSVHVTRSCFTKPSYEEQGFFACDLLVVLADEDMLPGNAEQIIKTSVPECEAIHLITHPMNFVVEQLQAYSLFFCWVQRHAILLHEQDHASELLPEPVVSLKSYERQATEFYNDNPGYANYDRVYLSPLPVPVTTGKAEDTTAVPLKLIIRKGRLLFVAESW